MARSPLTRSLGLLLFWMLVAAVFAINSHFMRVFAGRTVAPGQMLLWYELSWLFWWPASMVVLALAHRYPLDRTHWRRHAPVHGAVAVAVIILMTLWDVSVVHVVPRFVDLSVVLGDEPQRPFLYTFRDWLPSEASWGLLVYGAVLAAGHAREYYRSYRAEELAATRLESQLTQARLQVLLMRLQPHFLFNTLNAISALVHRDPDAAERTISRLSDLLRQTLEGADRQEVPLADELEFVRAYVDIERVRFGDRLLVQFDVAPDTRDAMVPQLVLQPLVENALRHGFAPDTPLARVEVRSRLRDGRIQLEVWDNGQGFGAGDDGFGLGLDTTRQRLAALYGDAHRFTVEEMAAGGVAATLELPLRMRGDELETGEGDGAAPDPRRHR